MKSSISDHQRIGKFISEVRELKGFTQKDFAKALKTSQSAVARMEKGQQNLTTQMLAKISQVLNQEIITLADKSINFKIEGGHKLSGKVSVNTSKNAAVALLCASLLNRKLIGLLKLCLALVCRLNGLTVMIWKLPHPKNSILITLIMNRAEKQEVLLCLWAH